MKLQFTLALVAVSASSCALEDHGVNDSDRPIEIPPPPVDNRPAVQQAASPPPISGGTLLVSSKKRYVASDPARGRVSFVDPAAPEQKRVTTLTLAATSRPSRLTEDAAGNIHVVLRGSGKVAMLEGAGSQVISKTSVCSTPRGIAYDANRDLLHVACAEGVLQSFKPGAAEIETELVLEPDLRDVVVEGERIYVSRFRSAEVLFIDAGEVVHRALPPRTRAFDPVREETRTRKANVAWRMIAAPQGGVLLLHQRSVTEAIAVGDEDENEEVPVETPPYGGHCEGIVQTAVTHILPDRAMASSGAIGGMVLGVDLATDAKGDNIAVVSAGLRDSKAPKPIGGSDEDASPDIGELLFGRGAVALLETKAFGPASKDPEVEVGCTFAIPTGSSSPGVAVVFDPDDLYSIVMQQQEPAVLQFARRNSLDDVSSSGEIDGEGSSDSGRYPTYNLGGVPVEDTGHEIFHRDSGANIACASCHPEGEDDGHVWTFSDVGPRKTQNLGRPLKDTAPFHWDGSLPTLRSLMDAIFVERMGGPVQSEERMRALETWMFAREATVVPAKNPAAAARGKKLFESEQVGCASCHSGTHFTDNKSYAVGTSNGEKLQVPPLRGLRLHPPFMHNGCAKTLRERFDPDCGGGDRHGEVSHLNPSELDDLVAYLESI